ncbi:GTPase [Nodularia sphaerocarpa]|uniref:GTPase n=1 Tax=Nodularia sphaerocarpa TaxID=137816 RepID=UPI001EFAC691|nr:GTPase [Nodularia sphaerocarpa]MDB9375082.1 50S ribosome-binding GTPase [Nodularia sphaerocarpa CS-585]MDB9376808.1 50S ribosome-binding GTPase [Nodularia sphaerocarpa CS-585A2]
MPIDKVSQAEFEDALKQCSQTANVAYNISLTYVNRTELILKNLNYDIRQSCGHLLSKKGADKFQFAGTLNQIQSNIKILSQETFEDLDSSLNTKRKYLENFTVALFGRTKAGKSTLRETLTRGNGSTIGKGSQRTTRDVKEYYWQGLRLLDTPGIEAYEGEDDTKQANDVIDQSDIVLFLTSDDSVQPGEFEAMAQLQEISKYFAVILNVKHDISNGLEDLQMFIDIPEMVFDEERLSQHQHHIHNHIQEFLQLDDVDITCIHAQAGFLSTKEEYQEYSSQLWELSKIEKLYSLITYQIYANGQNLRLSTFSDSLIKFISEIYQKLCVAKEELDKQRNLMGEQKQKIRKIFDEIKAEGNLKIKSQCEFLSNQIEKQIGPFVDKYAETDIEARKKEWQRIVNQKHIEAMMKGVINEIFLYSKEKLLEFEHEYEYDVNNIKIDLENLNIRDIRQDDTGKWIKLAGVAIGAVGAVAVLATNWWNPGGWVVAAGLVSTAASVGSGFAGEWKSREDDKNYKKNIQEEKQSLIKQVNENKKATVKSYQDCLETNIKQYQNQTLEQVDVYIKGLFAIIQDLDHAIAEIIKIKQEINSDFSNSK